MIDDVQRGNREFARDGKFSSMLSRVTVGVACVASRRNFHDCRQNFDGRPNCVNVVVTSKLTTTKFVYGFVNSIVNDAKTRLCR